MADEYTIAQAYVQIIPTTKDIGNSLEKVLGDEGKKAGEAAGKSIGTGLSGMAGTIGKAAGLALAGAAAVISKFTADSIETGKAFDSSMSQVAATMGFSVSELNKEGSEAQKTFKQLRDFAQDMGRTTAFSASEAADALNYMALAGYDADTSMEMLPTVLNLAAAGGIELAEASDMVTDTQSALGLSLKETATMVDQMARTSSKSNTSVEQLGAAMLKIGATARNTAGGTEELSTVLGVLADNGIKGAEGGTHLRNMILSLQSAAKDGAVDFGDFSVSVYDADGNMRSMIDIVGDMQTGMQGMSQEAKDAIVSGVFNKTDLSSVNALLGTSRERFEELSTAIRDSAGAAEEMANVQLDNLEGDMTLFNSALEGAQVAISDAVTPALRDMTQFATGAITNLTEQFQALPPEIQQTIGMIGLIGGKVLEVIPTVMQLASQIAMIKIAKGAGDGVSGFGSSLKNLAKPAGIAAAAIAAVAAGITYMRGEIDKATASSKGLKDAMSGLKEGYQDTHTQVSAVNEILDSSMSKSEKVAAVQELLAAAQEANRTATQGNAQAVEELNKVQDVQVSTGAKILGAFGGINADIIAQVEALSNSTDAWENSNDVMGTASDDVTYLRGVLNDLESQEDTVEEATKEVSGAFDTAAGTIEGYAKKTSEATGKISKATKENLDKVISATSNMKDAIGNAVKGISGWYDELEERQHRSTEELITNWQNQINATKTWEEDLNKLLELGIDKGLIERFAKAGPAGDEMMMALQDAMINNPGALPDLVNQVNDLFWQQMSMEEAMNDEAQGVLHATRVMTAGSEEELAQLLIEATGIGKQLPKGLAESIVASAPDVDTAARILKNHAISLDLYGPGYDIGTNLVNGIVKGINAHADSAVNAAAAMSNRTISKTRNVMAVQSPSKVFEEIGMYLDLGLAKGIENNSDKAIDQAVQMAEGVNDAMDTMNTGYSVSAHAAGMTTTAEQMRAASYGMAAIYAANSAGAGGGYMNNITLNVYAAKGQNEEAIAMAVMQRIQHAVNKKGAVFA